MGAGQAGSLAGPRCPVWLALPGGASCHGEKHLPSRLPKAAQAGSRAPSPAPAWGEGAVRVMLWGLRAHPAPQTHTRASTCPLASYRLAKPPPRGHHLPGLGGCGDLDTLETRHPLASPQAAVGTEGLEGRPQLSLYLLLNTEQFCGWHRVSVPAQHRLCSSRKVMRGGSAPKQTVGDVQSSTSARLGRGCSKGTGQDPAPPRLAAGFLPAGAGRRRSRRAARQWADTAVVPAALAGALGSPTSETKVQLQISTPSAPE